MSEQNQNIYDAPRLKITLSAQVLRLARLKSAAGSGSSDNDNNDFVLANGSRVNAGNAGGHTSAMTQDDDDGEGWIGVGASAATATLGESAMLKKGFFDDDAPTTTTTSTTSTTSTTTTTGKLRPAIATTDFAMQNVILRMGLLLATIDGETDGTYVVKTLKSWVMRCPACFTVAADKGGGGNSNSNSNVGLFCGKCGSAGLERIAASTDPKTGERKLHLSKKRRDQNVRGTKFTMPKAGNQGRYDGDLLLREDQLLSGNWAIKVKKGKGVTRSVFGDDVAEGVGLGDLTKRDDIKIGFGRRNPNAAKTGRERRGKKKKDVEGKACGLRRNFS